jgi:hypothetical protein
MFKKLFALSVLFLALVVPSYFALAQSSHCIVNGQEVPCGTVGKFLGLGLGGLLFIFVLAILAIIFWIMMLVHAASKPIENKAMWIIIIVIFGIIGALVYYFAVKRKFNSRTMQSPPSVS